LFSVTAAAKRFHSLADKERYVAWMASLDDLFRLRERAL